MKRPGIFIAFSLCQLLLFSTALTSAQKPETKVRGYITSLSSPLSFDIADYHVTRTADVALEFQDAGPDVVFRPEDFRAGIEVEVRGVYDEQTGELRARKIKIDLDQFRKLKQTVVLSRQPEKLERVGDKWRAILSAGGRTVRIEPSTNVEFRLSTIEQEDIKRSAKEKDLGSKLHTLSSLEEVRPGVLMTFEGKVLPDGTVAAERAEFRRNEKEKDEEAISKMAKTKVKTDKENKPSSLKITLGLLNVDLKLLPDDVQDYVAKVGNSLIPPYQRALADADVTKIPFRFYAVERPETFMLSLPNGIVVVSSALLELLENEAQLASLMGREIAHIVQKHNFRQWQESTQKRFSLVFGRAGSYSRLNQVQADRLALEYMQLAGYDLREAPRAWKLLAEKNPSEDEIITRRSSVMVALQDTYPQSGASGARKNEEEFRQVANRIHALMAEASAKQKK